MLEQMNVSQDKYSGNKRMIILQIYRLGHAEFTLNTYAETTENIVGRTEYIFQLRTAVEGEKYSYRIGASNLAIVELAYV